MRTRHFAPLLLAATLAACAGPQAQTATDTPGISPAAATTQPATVSQRLVDEPGRRVVKLSNGFTVLLQQNKTAPVVAARVYVKAGALTEQQFMGAGISHVLEHLVAGASSGKRKEAENILLLQQIGNDSNAYTDADHTCYFITTSPDKWQVALDLLVDWTTAADFTPEQFAREYKVVQRELEMGEAEADRTFYLQTQSTRYLFSPARHPIIGYKPAFQKLTFADCRAYYKQMYVPDNMVISVGGDIDLDDAEKAITAQLQGIRRTTVPNIALAPEPAVTVPRRSVAHADVKEARVEWAFPTVSMYSPDLYAADVLSSVLGGGESSILTRRLRDELGLVFGIEASNPTPSYVEGQLTIDAVVAPEKVLAAQTAVLSVLDDVLKNGVPAEAVERAKAKAAASLVYGNQTAEQQAIRNALDFLVTGNIDFTENYVKRIQAVTPEEVGAVARKYVNTNRLLTTLLLPLEAKDPFAPAAATRQAITQDAVKKTVLKNGLTLLVSRNTSAPIVTFSLYSLGGMLAESDANNGVGNAMMELMTRGTQTRSHEQIGNFLDATGTSLAAEAGNNSFSLAMQCLKQNAPAAFELFSDVALHPKFDTAELEQLRPQLLAAVEQSTEDWFDEAYKATKEAYYARSPYRRLPIGRADVLTKLTPAAVREHYDQYFLNPKQTVLAIAGDFDPAMVEKWAQAFEGVTEKTPKTPLAMQSVANPAKKVAIHTEKKSATVMFAFPPGVQITNPDRYPLIVLQTYLGGYSSPGGSVLHETLRGKGLVYTVQASVGSGPAGGLFLIYALGEPQNAEEIVTNVEQIIRDVKAGKIPDTLVAAAKDQAITGQRLSKQTIADKSSAQAVDELLGLGYGEEEAFPKKIQAVTKAELIRVANQYLLPPVIVVSTPEAKK